MATRLEIYFFASEAPRKGVSSLSPDNVFAAEESALYSERENAEAY
jgi:hypothetical protein